jgi:protease II
MGSLPRDVQVPNPHTPTFWSRHGRTKPILLDVDYDAGHGIGSPRERTRKLWADEMAFAP